MSEPDCARKIQNFLLQFGRLHMSQIFLVNGLLTISGEIAAPNAAERSHDSECHCRKTEAPVKG